MPIIINAIHRFSNDGTWHPANRHHVKRRDVSFYTPCALAVLAEMLISCADRNRRALAAVRKSYGGDMLALLRCENARYGGRGTEGHISAGMRARQHARRERRKAAYLHV